MDLETFIRLIPVVFILFTTFYQFGSNILCETQEKRLTRRLYVSTSNLETTVSLVRELQPRTARCQLGPYCLGRGQKKTICLHINLLPCFERRCPAVNAIVFYLLITDYVFQMTLSAALPSKICRFSRKRILPAPSPKTLFST